MSSFIKKKILFSFIFLFSFSIFSQIKPFTNNDAKNEKKELEFFSLQTKRFILPNSQDKKNLEKAHYKELRKMRKKHKKKVKKFQKKIQDRPTRRKMRKTKRYSRRANKNRPKYPSLWQKIWWGITFWK